MQNDDFKNHIPTDANNVLAVRASPFLEVHKLNNKKMIREMFEDMPIVSSIIAIIILGLTFY